MDCSLPGSSVHGIFQAGIPEWVEISYSRRSFLNQGSNLHLLGSPALVSRFFTTAPPGKPVLIARMFNKHLLLLGDYSRHSENHQDGRAVLEWHFCFGWWLMGSCLHSRGKTQRGILAAGVCRLGLSCWLCGIKGDQDSKETGQLCCLPMTAWNSELRIISRLFFGPDMERGCSTLGTGHCHGTRLGSEKPRDAIWLLFLMQANQFFGWLHLLVLQLMIVEYCI